MTGSHKRWVLELWRPAVNNISVGNTHPLGSLTHQHCLTLGILDWGLIQSAKPLSILMHLTNPQLSPSLSDNGPSRNCLIPSSSTLSQNMWERQLTQQQFILNCFKNCFSLIILTGPLRSHSSPFTKITSAGFHSHAG